MSFSLKHNIAHVNVEMLLLREKRGVNIGRQLADSHITCVTIKSFLPLPNSQMKKSLCKKFLDVAIVKTHMDSAFFW